MWEISIAHVVLVQVARILQHLIEIGTNFLASNLCVVKTNVFKNENQHSDPHQQTIQKVEESLVRDDVTIVTLKILNQAHNGTDENQNRTHKKSHNDHLPVSFAGREVSVVQGELGWVSLDSDLENG